MATPPGAGVAVMKKSGGRRGGGRRGGRGGSGRGDSPHKQQHKDTAAAPGKGRRRSRCIDPSAFERQLEEQRQRQQQRMGGGRGGGGGEGGGGGGDGSATGAGDTGSGSLSSASGASRPAATPSSSHQQQQPEQRRPQLAIRGTAFFKTGSSRGSANCIILSFQAHVCFAYMYLIFSTNEI